MGMFMPSVMRKGGPSVLGSFRGGPSRMSYGGTDSNLMDDEQMKAALAKKVR